MLGMLRTLRLEWVLSDRITLGASLSLLDGPESLSLVLFALFLCDDDEVAGRAALAAPGDDEAVVLKE